MPDLAYIAAGYAATAVTVAGYRWRLAVRMRRARQYVTTAAGRAPAGRDRP
jgi:hypothetical protein